MNFRLFLNNYFPITVRLILVKALLFFMFYKFIFSFELTPLNYPLTSHVGEYSTKLLNVFIDPAFNVKREYVNNQVYQSSQIYFNNTKVVYIANSCNGFIAFMRYISIIFCFPSRFWRKFLYLIIGLLTIHILNIIRCAALAYINLYHQPYFVLAHDYLFKMVLYGAIFIMWILYLRKVQFQDNTWFKKPSLI